MDLFYFNKKKMVFTFKALAISIQIRVHKKLKNK